MDTNKSKVEEKLENKPLTKWEFDRQDPTEEQIERRLSILAV